MYKRQGLTIIDKDWVEGREVLEPEGWDPAKFLAEYNQYFGNDSPFAWYLITDYFMAVPIENLCPVTGLWCR